MTKQEAQTYAASKFADNDVMWEWICEPLGVPAGTTYGEYLSTEQAKEVAAS